MLRPQGASHTRRWMIGVACVVFGYAVAVPAAWGVVFDPPIQVGANASPALPEISGLAASRATPGTLWVHNDHGDTARFYAMSTGGDLLGTFPLDGATAVDWEDIAIGSKAGGGSYLYLGDIGDNHDNHPSVSIYRVAEPDSTASAKIPMADYTRVTVQYQEGPRDAESMLVDPLTNDLFIITKSSTPQVYRLDASAFDSPSVVNVLSAQGYLGAPLYEPRAADISPDGRHIVVRNTSTTAYLFERLPGTSVLDALTSPGIPIGLTPEPQGEAIAWAADGSGFYTTSERNSLPPTPIYFYRFSAPEPSTLISLAVGVAAIAACARKRPYHSIRAT